MVKAVVDLMKEKQKRVTSSRLNKIQSAIQSDLDVSKCVGKRDGQG